MSLGKRSVTGRMLLKPREGLNILPAYLIASIQIKTNRFCFQTFFYYLFFFTKLGVKTWGESI